MPKVFFGEAMNKRQQSNTWKNFEQNPLTHSAAHYLMTIYELHQEHGYARVTDIAKRLNISPGSCSITLKSLRKKGFVEEDNNRFLKLSKVGAELAAIVQRNEDLLFHLFHEVVGADKEQSSVNACKMEHLLTPELADKLEGFLEKN